MEVWVEAAGAGAGAPLALALPAGACAEEAVRAACKRLRLAPAARPLLALRPRAERCFLPDAAPVQPRRHYQLRVRYKVPKLRHLKSLDDKAYDFYFQQARNDVIENNIPEIQYPLHKKELLGLGITDMYRAILEDNMSLSEVERNYKRYIPKEIVRKHQFFTKKPIHNTLQQICANPKAGHDVNYIKGQYLQQLMMMAPNYLSEEYSCRYDMGSNEWAPGKIQVIPFHQHEPGLRIFNELKKTWVHICTIEQLCFLGRKASDHEVEVCRKNGIPMYFKFNSASEISSFISCCDGYYRLMVKWTFNLSKDDPTPSLQRLYRMKCHGPVGGEFSYHKLEEKRAKKHGCFILRECQHDYDVYYIDVCTKNNTTETYKVEYEGHCYIFNSDKDRPYSSLECLINSFNDSESRIYLEECLPPSEYDKSQLLLCGEHHKVGVRIDQTELQELLKHHKSPRCINTKDILYFKGAWCYTTDKNLTKDLCDVRDCALEETNIVLTKKGGALRYIYMLPEWKYTGTQVLGSEGITATYKAIWKLDETKKIEVALKTLVREKIDSHLKDFIELANKWACVQSSAVVRLYGVTLMSPSSLVMEYLQYGPLDVYLSENGDSVEPIHLIKAAAALARALWDLTEAGCVHGRIRCSKVLLAQHDHEKFIVKLSDPGLHNYTEDDCHWIPVEYFSDMNLARKCVSADVWAFGTTLWEMFSYGLSPTQTNPVLRAKSYEIGHRLSCPQQCPRDVWEVIRECWLPDPHRRAIPQVIMRDISHLLHREYIPTANPYESIDLPEVSAYVSGAVETVSSEFLFNNQTSDTISDRSQVTVDSSLSLPSTSFITGPEHDMTMESVYPYDSYQSYETDAHHMQWILGLGPDCRVTLHKRIGVGNYGEVCKGILERDDYKESQLVAVKKLKSNGDQGMLNDFRKEIEVMKSLQHANIVEILGVCEEREMLIVMEYIEHGALNSYLKIYKYKLQHTHLLKYALDVACGMDYLSAKHLVHRDLAARNILVVDEHNVKISDFGLARFTTDNDKYQMKTVRDLPLSWYAPESAVQYEFSSQSDVWSYGVTLWEMFTYGLVEVPSFDLKEPHNRAESFVMPEGCPSDVYRRLMSPCWNYLPADRPKFIQLTHICKQLMMQY